MQNSITVLPLFIFSAVTSLRVTFKSECSPTEDLEAEEVADYLATIMDQELNTMVEDESDIEVSRHPCYSSLADTTTSSFTLQTHYHNRQHFLCTVQDRTHDEM